MAKLTAAKRKKLPASDFAGPDRSFPVQDKSHAADAKSRVANRGPALKARVDAKADKVLKASKGMTKVAGPRQRIKTEGPIAPDKLSSMVKSLRTP